MRKWNYLKTYFLKNIEALIFDLGGVIVDLDMGRTVNAFNKFIKTSAPVLQEGLYKNPLFTNFEKGQISAKEFRAGIRKLAEWNLSDAEIDIAWNAMLGPVPKEKISLLKRLRPDYQTFILSNTNSIHIQAVHQRLRNDHNIPDFSPLIEKVYYSYEIGMRKPDQEIFEFVIKSNKLIPSKTLFLDDNLDNIEGAMKAGLKVSHISQPDDLFSVFE